MVGGDKKALIVRNPGFAETQRRMFELAWLNCPMPKSTSAKVTYD
jgi:hypothetical protein